MAFIFNQTGVSAQMETTYSEYGVKFIYESTSEPTFWEKILSVILTPVVIVVVIVLALVIGTVIFIKRKRKNAKKNS